MSNLANIFIIVVVTNIFLALAQSSSAVSEYNEKSCPQRCSEQYDPICAVNEAGENAVFVNDCYLALENCNLPNEKVYRKAESGNCPDYATWVDKDWKENTNEV